MKRLFITAMLTLACIFSLTAQSENIPEQTGPQDKPIASYEYEPIRKGDQLITVHLGAVVPLFNTGGDIGFTKKTNMNVGGLGTIGFSQFINNRIALGGEVSFAFNTTLGDNLYFYIPMMFTTSYETVFDRIRVPVSLGVGFAFQTYNSINYFGPLIRPKVGAYYQYSPSWSFGLAAEWSTIFQFYKESKNNRINNMANILVGMRYHF